jgi:hypothetical protein
MFARAERSKKKLRFAISGVSGGGKTYTALTLAEGLGNKIAVIDTEHGSSSLYADRFEFDCCNLVQYHPTQYIEAIRYAGQNGYDVIVVDSLSHAWWEMLNLAGGNFNNWAKVKPLERALTQAILGSPAHVIVTMRAKTEYAQEKDSSGRTIVKKLGTQAVQAQGIEYEFDVAGEIDINHCLTISKSRFPELADTRWMHPDSKLAETILDCLSKGKELAQSASSEIPMATSEQARTVKSLREQVGLNQAQILAEMRDRFGATRWEEMTRDNAAELIELLSATAESTIVEVAQP